MAGRRRAQSTAQRDSLPVEDYRHKDATRLNNPPAAIAAEGRTPPDKPSDPALRPLRRLCTKLATGSGKTLVAAMLITWAFVNRGISPESREYPNIVLICA